MESYLKGMTVMLKGYQAGRLKNKSEGNRHKSCSTNHIKKEKREKRSAAAREKVCTEKVIIVKGDEDMG